MKLTKSKLKQLIKEELEAVREAEGVGDETSMYTSWPEAWMANLKKIKKIERRLEALESAGLE